MAKAIQARRKAHRRALSGSAAALVCGLFAASIAGAANPIAELDAGPDGTPIIRMTTPDAPTPAPAVSFVDASGATQPLAAYKGKLTALHFWATWCAPCRVELPKVDAMAAALAGADFAVVPVSVDRDGPEIVTTFYEQHQISNLPLFLDNGLAAFRAFKLGGVPATVFIDAEGNEIARVLGDRDWSSPEVIELIRKMIERS
ncbi:MAG: TlpA family protein disulfide reductase [Alphaproteobacteria bacterium]